MGRTLHGPPIHHPRNHIMILERPCTSERPSSWPPSGRSAPYGDGRSGRSGNLLNPLSDAALSGVRDSSSFEPDSVISAPSLYCLQRYSDIFKRHIQQLMLSVVRYGPGHGYQPGTMLFAAQGDHWGGTPPGHPGGTVRCRLDGERQCPQGAIRGLPGDGGCAAYGGVRHQARGWAGGPPSLPLLFPCPVRAAGHECGDAPPGLRAVCLPRCLPSSAWAAGHAARVRLVPSS